MTAAALLATVLYVIAGALLARPLLGHAAPGPRGALAIAAVAMAAHAVVLFGSHRGAPDLHFFSALSLVGWVVSGFTLGVNLWRPFQLLGVIVFPFAALLLGIDAFAAPATAPQSFDWQIKLHVGVALLAYGVLSIAAALAILLALQDRTLRHRRFGALLRALPPLTLTESLLFRLIGAGFVLLSLTLLTGILFVENLFAQHLVHKTVLSIAAWLVFGVLLFGRRTYGWRGRRAINLTLSGMAILVLAFFGSKFVLEVLLHRAA